MTNMVLKHRTYVTIFVLHKMYRRTYNHTKRENMYTQDKTINDDKYLAISNDYLRGKTAYLGISNRSQISNLFEAKLEILALRHLTIDPVQVKKKDAQGNFYIINSVVLNASEIKMLDASTPGEKGNAKSIYKRIEDVALSLKNKQLIFRDAEQKKFRVTGIYEDVYYENGKITLEYNPQNEKFFLGLYQNFTKVCLPILFSFRHSGGFRLYSLLETYAYQLGEIDLSKTQDEQPFYDFTCPVAELRIILGYANVADREILRRTEGAKSIDYENLEKYSKDVKYKKWTDFNKRVILPGIKEINELSDIYVSDYITYGNGRGGKIQSVTFRIQKNLSYYQDGVSAAITNTKENNKNTSSMAPSEAIEEIQELLKDVSVNEIDAEILYNDAKGNINIIKELYEISKKQSYIRNFIGWMRIAIKDYLNGNKYTNISTSFGDHEKAYQAEVVKENLSYTNSLKEKVWEKFKKKPEFEDFLKITGLEISCIEALDVDDRIEMFRDFLFQQSV